MTDIVFKVDERGVTAPSYEEIYQELIERTRLIFGQDINLDDDTPDGQFLAIVAKAINDVNNEAIELHADFSPKTAQRMGLDLAVKTNGLKRGKAVGSTVDLTLVGQGGTLIVDGEAMDEFRNRWKLPHEVRIPSNGEITVTARAKGGEAFSAEAGAIHLIGTPVRGWQTVTNKKPAIVGTPVESDAQLRERQKISTASPSRSIWEGIVGSVLGVTGVKRVSGIRNNDDTPTAEGVPGHTIALVVDGGDVEEIAKTIFLKCGDGTGTHGAITTVLLDKYQFPQKVRFSRPTPINIKALVKIKPSSNYETSVEEVIKERVASYVSKLAIGESVSLGRVMATVIKTDEGVIDDRFEVLELTIGKNSEPKRASSVAIRWDEGAFCTVESVDVQVQGA